MSPDAWCWLKGQRCKVERRPDPETSANNAASPEVDLPQAEVDPQLRDLDGSVDHLHLALLHRARQPRLPADHELTGGLVGAAGRNDHVFRL